MSGLEIVKNCKVHGKLTAPQCYYRKNRDKYECRQCMRDSEKRRPKRVYEGDFADYHRQYAKNWREANKEAVNLKIREDRKSNPDKYREWEQKQRYKDIERSRYRDVLTKHKINASEYDMIFESHEGRCAICNNYETRMSSNGVTTTRIALDHCHQCENLGYTGMDVIRGLLCHDCNKSLGGFKDSIEILQSAIEYLKKHKHCENEKTPPTKEAQSI